MAAGVLALQGDFAAHVRVLRQLGEPVVEVRRCADLAPLDALVLPGGESTAVLRLMEGEPWLQALRAFHERGGALLGTCAGAILLARTVLPNQGSLGVLDVVVERNAYGRQLDSFEADLDAVGGRRLRGVFIRAPRFRALGNAVEILARLEGEPVLVREGRVMAATFHPEILGEGAIHQMFLQGSRTAVQEP